MAKQYGFKTKLKHFWTQAKPGAKKANGKELTPFERGVNAGRAKQMQQSAYSYYKQNPDKVTDTMRATSESIRAKKRDNRAKYFASKNSK